jgi:hypothetical protein
MALVAICHTLCHNHLRRKFFFLSLVLISENKGSSGKREIQQQSLSLKEALKANGFVCVCALGTTFPRSCEAIPIHFSSFSLAHKEKVVFFYSSVGNWLDARGVRAAYLGSGAGAGWIRTRRQAGRQLRGGEAECKGEIGAQIMQGEQPAA